MNDQERAKAAVEWLRGSDLDCRGVELCDSLIELLRPIAAGTRVIVPIEPTMKMVEAALASTSYHHNFEAQMGEHLSKLNVNREKMKIRYRAMIAASQEGEK